jgi:hypothetical protein
MKKMVAKKLAGLLIPLMFSLVLNHWGVVSAQEVQELVVRNWRANHMKHAQDWRDNTAVLTIISPKGLRRVREGRRFTKNYEKEGIDYKEIIFMTAPENIRGLGILSWTYLDKTKEDDTWLWLPSLRKVRRMTAADGEDSFFGTDLTFDEVTLRNPEDENHRLIREEKWQGKKCYVIESTTKKVPWYYTTRIWWVDKEHAIEYTQHYFNEEGILFKTLEKKWDLIKGGWTWNLWDAHELRTKSQSLVDIGSNGSVFNTGLADDLFTQRTLTRMR